MIFNNTYLKIVKGALAIMQGVATFAVFYQANLHYSRPVAALLAASAVITVDGMILFCFSVLENMSIPARDKHPFALLTLLLTGAVFGIGYLEAGSILAFAPRLGLIALALGDVFVYVNQWQQEYNSREAKEQRIRDGLVIKRRNAKKTAEESALRALKPELKERAVAMLRRDLGLDVIEPAPVLIDKRPAPKPVVEDGVVQLSARKWGYYDPYTGELITSNASGKPYTERGAKIAFSRVSNRQQENAQLELLTADSLD